MLGYWIKILMFWNQIHGTNRIKIEFVFLTAQPTGTRFSLDLRNFKAFLKETASEFYTNCIDRSVGNTFCNKIQLIFPVLYCVICQEQGLWNRIKSTVLWNQIQTLALSKRIQTTIEVTSQKLHLRRNK